MDSRQASLEMHHRNDNDCEFCPPSGRLEWFNRPVAVDDDYAIAVPSLGSFVPGYLLAVPVAHVTASCRIQESDKARFASFVNKLAFKLTSIYETQVTVFEHGACLSSQEPQSACVNHAHVHLVPGNYDLTTEAPSPVYKHDSFAEFMEEEQSKSYLMLQDPGGPLLSFEDKSTSQYFRRIIAQRLGIPDYWDYAMFPFFKNIKRTYHDFGIDAPQ
jgi:diadenosine tetraphosphate (Ap4A) HIT family hydrolase